MPQAQPEWDAQSDSKRLSQAMDKLRTRGQQHLHQKYGLSEDFADKVESEERAMELCAQAMETLAGPFVDHLVAFRDATDTMHALQSLESAETLWQGESVLITQFDAEGQEREFLGQVRKQAYALYADKLEEVARQTKKDASPENVALCLALLGILDSIQESFGVPADDPNRQRLQNIAKAFA